MVLSRFSARMALMVRPSRLVDRDPAPIFRQPPRVRNAQPRPLDKRPRS